MPPLVRARVFAVPPKAGSPLGFSSWTREMGSLVRVRMKPPVLPMGAPPGDGHAVLVLPGFLTGDWATERLRAFLGGLGYRVATAQIAVNLGPTRSLVDRLDAGLAALAEGGAVTVIGISLGGLIARELAKRHPARIRRVVTVVTPVRLPVETNLSRFVALTAPFFDARVIASPDAIATPPPVPLTAFYTPDDGIVDWQACVPEPSPGLECFRVDGPHTTASSHPEVMRIVADRLAGPRTVLGRAMPPPGEGHQDGAAPPPHPDMEKAAE